VPNFSTACLLHSPVRARYRYGKAMSYMRNFVKQTKNCIFIYKTTAMAISLNDLTEHINDEKTGTVIKLILDYAILKQKLNRPKSASWYEKLSEESRRKKTDELKKEFEGIRDIVNNNSLDDLLEDLSRAEQNKKRLESFRNRNSVIRTGLSMASAEISYRKELIALKSVPGKLKSIDFYIENPEALKELPGSR
jgi:hypothetical protein